jgi:type II secretory pathway pseudopilin PulG
MPTGRGWEIKMKYKSSGFTLIEAVLGMAMLAVIGVMTVPDFVVAADAASAQAKWNISVTAKNSHDVIATQTGNSPTVVALAEGVSGKAVSDGILVQVDGDNFTIPTYTNLLCNKPTKNINEKVGCVGSIS